LNIKKLIYIEENFLTPDECKAFIDYVNANQKENKENFFKQVVDKVTSVCKSFDERSNLDYVGVARWPVGTFKEPHYDDSARDHIFDIFAALIYLNDDFSGGHTGFENFDVMPKTGQLCIFSNSQYKHHVTEVKDAERFVLSFWYNNDCKPRLVKTLKIQSINYDGASLTFI